MLVWERGEARLLSEVRHLLEAGGWHPSRDVSGRVEEWVEGLPEFEFSSAARAFLSEFGGLKLGASGPGRDRARSTIVVDPTLAMGESDRFEHLFGPSPVSPLGEVDDGHAFLVVDDASVAWLAMDERLVVGRTLEEALQNLLLGRSV